MSVANVYRLRKKNAKKRAKRRGVNHFANGKPYKNRGDYRTVVQPSLFPDRIVEVFHYSELPTNRFITAAAVASIVYNGNSMSTLFNGGSTASIPYYNTLRGNYVSYRVLRSTIVVKCTSREAVNAMEVLVVPMSGVLPSITSSAEYVNCASLKNCQRKMVPAYVGGNTSVTLKQTVDLSKFFGPEYLTDPNYSGGALSTSDPSTLMYWVIAYYNPNINTVTTGGLMMQVTLHQTIELYDPDRTEAVGIVDPNNPNQLLPRSEQIAVEMKTLAEELKSLKA